MMVERTEQAFEGLPAGRRARAVFRVRNAGDRRLILRSLDPPCCGPVDLPRNFTIPPGSTQELRIEVLVPPAPGRQATLMSEFSTNDPDAPRLRLWLRGPIVDE